MSYRGWVPTVNGRLSFKLIGESRYPSEADYANFSTVSHQYALAVQTRNLSDVLFDRFLSALLSVSGEFNFYLCGRSRRGPGSADAYLIGKLYVFRRFCEGSYAVSGGIKHLLTQMRNTTFLDQDDGAQSSYLSAHDLLASNCDISADFVLRRNGMISISKLAWSDNEFARNSVDYEQDRHVDLEQSVADQLYFFVRDISHQHQHHGPDADTIITTHRSQADNLQWCNGVIYSLYFHIINIKRRSDPIEHVRVLGILAYLQSFKKVAEIRAEQIKKTAQSTLF
ncbi:hypothetical protein [Mesorhizobium sp. Mes31]|uniref:hypothetical protein n=1 Tax=Mesorhizobium sp. Mes31 TaxID=2926017 RepID=UPI0021191751|nr:hypothetical protein [Mesorhizobium sp. Mes31]